MSAQTDKDIRQVSAPDDWPVTLDGALMPASQASISASDDALVRGDGAFDAFPVRDGPAFARAAHLDRLERSCVVLRASWRRSPAG